MSVSRIFPCRSSMVAHIALSLGLLRDVGLRKRRLEGGGGGGGPPPRSANSASQPKLWSGG